MTPNGLPAQPRSWGEWGAVVGLLLLFAVLSFSAAQQKSYTFDEETYVTRGFSYWTLNDYRLNPEAGNWIQRWTAIPFLVGHFRFPPLDQRAWRESNMWEMSDQFVFGVGNDLNKLLFRSRFMMLILSLIFGWVVYAWSRSLFGPLAGILSLCLYVLSPSMLAGGCLVTADLPAAGWLTAATWSLWRLMHRVTWFTVLASALCLAWLCLTKLSAVLILPVSLILLLVRIRGGRALDWRLGHTRKIVQRGRQIRVLAMTAVFLGLFVWACIWGSFGFRYAVFAPNLEAGRGLMEERAVMESSTLGRIDALHLLPQAYTYGMDYVFSHAQARNAFMNGEFRDQGWLSFYPYCMLVKNPLSLFVILGLAFAAMAFNWRRRSAATASRVSGDGPSVAYEIVPLLVLLVVYWEGALTCLINIGNHHLLPAYPPTIILAGAAVWMCRADPASEFRILRQVWVTHFFTVLLLGALALHMFETIRIWPDFLAYFNRIAGGPAQAYRHLVNSSLDWGQDLPALQRWLKQNHKDPAATVYLSYFGTARPEAHGVKAIRLPSFFDVPSAGVWPQPLRGGLYCISATMLQPVYHDYPGPWNPAYETLWQETQAWYKRISAAVPDNGMAGSDGEAVRRCLRQYEQLRFGRLCSYLRRREPAEQLGYSILVYRLSDDEVREALFGAPVFESDHPARPIEVSVSHGSGTLMSARFLSMRGD